MPQNHGQNCTGALGLCFAYLCLTQIRSAGLAVMAALGLSSRRQGPRNRPNQALGQGLEAIDSFWLSHIRPCAGLLTGPG